MRTTDASSQLGVLGLAMHNYQAGGVKCLEESLLIDMLYCLSESKDPKRADTS